MDLDAALVVDIMENGFSVKHLKVGPVTAGLRNLFPYGFHRPTGVHALASSGSSCPPRVCLNDKVIYAYS